MRKLVLVVVSLLLTTLVSYAQSSHAFEKGYRGNVSLTGNIGISKGLSHNGIELTTSHGYSFGDGMYMGGGIGMNIVNDCVNFPVYFDMKYNLLDWKLSPYMDCRVGVTIAGEDGIPFMASPGVGFDYRKMSFRVGYKCEAGWGYKLHTVSIGTSVNF